MSPLQVSTSACQRLPRGLGTHTYLWLPGATDLSKRLWLTVGMVRTSVQLGLEEDPSIFPAQQGGGRGWGEGLTQASDWPLGVLALHQMAQRGHQRYHHHH